MQGTGRTGQEGTPEIRMQKKHRPPSGLEGQRGRWYFRAQKLGLSWPVLTPCGVSEGARGMVRGAVWAWSLSFRSDAGTPC